VADLKRDKRLWRFSKLRQIKYLNNIGRLRAAPNHRTFTFTRTLQQNLPASPHQRRSAGLIDVVVS
jgi:hypothetical protein